MGGHAASMVIAERAHRKLSARFILVLSLTYIYIYIYIYMCVCVCVNIY